MDNLELKFDYFGDTARTKEYANEKETLAKQKGRIHLYNYDGKKGEDYYAIAGEKITVHPRNKSQNAGALGNVETPALGFFDRFFHISVLVPDPDDPTTTFYKINQRSLRRLGFCSKDIEQYVDKNTRCTKVGFYSIMQQNLIKSLASDVNALKAKLNAKEYNSSVPDNNFIQYLQNLPSQLRKTAFKEFIQENPDKAEKLSKFLLNSTMLESRAIDEFFESYKGYLKTMIMNNQLIDLIKHVFSNSKTNHLIGIYYNNDTGEFLTNIKKYSNQNNNIFFFPEADITRYKDSLDQFRIALGTKAVPLQAGNQFDGQEILAQARFAIYRM
jgi:hypothetical protein